MSGRGPEIYVEELVPSLGIEDTGIYSIDISQAPGPPGADPTVENIGALIAGADAKADPADADSIGLSDSEADGILKKITFAELWTWVKSLADLVYQPVSTALSKITESGGLPLWEGGAWPGGGGGGEWAEIQRQTVSSPVSSVDFVDKFTDDYDTFRLKIINAKISTIGQLRLRFGHGAGPTWITGAVYPWHLQHSTSGSVSYNGYRATNDTQGVITGTNLNALLLITCDIEFRDLRNAAHNPAYVIYKGSLVYNQASALIYGIDGEGELVDTTNQIDHLRIKADASQTIDEGIYILEGRNA